MTHHYDDRRYVIDAVQSHKMQRANIRLGLDVETARAKNDLARKVWALYRERPADCPF
jgi:hypothetical protein